MTTTTAAPPTTITELFEQTRDLFASSELSWIRLANARTRPYGYRVRAESPDATCWCLGGALIRLAGDKPGNLLIDVTNFLADRMNITLPDWNDNPDRTREDVIEMLERAIELSKSE